jgi:hypothetical protein
MTKKTPTYRVIKDEACTKCLHGMKGAVTEDKFIEWSSFCDCARVLLEDGTSVPIADFINDKNNRVISLSVPADGSFLEQKYNDAWHKHFEATDRETLEMLDEKDPHVETAQRMMEAGEPGMTVAPGQRLKTMPNVCEETYLHVEDPTGALSELMEDFKKKVHQIVARDRPKSCVQEDIEEFEKNNIPIADLTLKELLHIRGFGVEGKGWNVWQMINYIKTVWTAKASRIGTLYFYRDRDGTLELRLPLRWKVSRDEFRTLRMLLEKRASDGTEE